MKKALVVLSGGQDSVTCLFWAKARFDEVHAITFNYGQRHAIEIDAARVAAQHAEVLTHEIVALPDTILRSTSPLVEHARPVGQYESADVLPGGIEDTFVPMRNALFLTLAANRAAALGEEVTIVTGVSQEDFGGYPDCRLSFITAQQTAIDEALPEAYDIQLAAPLIDMTKKQTVELAAELSGGAGNLGACWRALAHSHTCYNGQFPPCGKCHACLLRERGFKEAGYADPLVSRAITEGACNE